VLAHQFTGSAVASHDASNGVAQFGLPKHLALSIKAEHG
jgi:hypothetical protein